MKTLGPGASTEKILKATDRDGACIVGDVLSSDLLARIDDEVAPLIAKASLGSDDVAGRQTAVSVRWWRGRPRAVRSSCTQWR